MKAIVSPSLVSGTLLAPTSKSAMQRACAASLIKKGTSMLLNPGKSADDQAALDIIQRLGAEVTLVNDSIQITSNGINPRSTTIECGESGLSVRMFTSIAAVSDRELTINGSGSLLKRPVSFFDEVLPFLDVYSKTNNGLLPLHLKGPLQPKNITVDGSLSSQFLTGLLFAYAAADASDVSIYVNNLNSKPYIDLTIDILNAFGLKAPINNSYEEFYFEKKSKAEFESSSITYKVEGDWSGGAFLLVAGAVAGNVVIDGLNIFSSQADKAVIEPLLLSGAALNVNEQEITVSEQKLKAFDFDATDCPDLFPPLVALATYCQGKSVIKGVNRLTHKESNRALTLQEEFGKFGVTLTLDSDRMIIEGVDSVKSCEVNSHHDHRIAMACAVTALKADGPVTINGAEAVNKSYPGFWKDIQQLNATLSLI
jgi:3-phosphoshikimate 1-carboxyvinyltransferase